MNTYKSILNLPVRVVRRLQRERFYRKYIYIDRSSRIGSNGIGKGCLLEGDENITIGKNTFIGEGSELIAYKSHFERLLDSHLTIGDHVRITARCRITCAGNITIEDDVLFAPDVFVTDHNHGTNPEIEGGYSPQDITIKDVVIKKGAWLGQRACVLPGVVIGEHSIIGANSVVTKAVPAFSMAVGSPAKVIKRWNFVRKQWESV